MSLPRFSLWVLTWPCFTDVKDDDYIVRNGLVRTFADEFTDATYLTFEWWTGSTLDHVYRYKPEYGMTNAWPQ